MVANITADSIPDYDEIGPDSHWNADDWMAWHHAMVQKFGLSAANRKWSDAWLAGVSRAGGGKGTAPGSGMVLDSVPISDRTSNRRFYDFLTSNPSLYSVVYSGVTSGLSEGSQEVNKQIPKVIKSAGKILPMAMIALAIGAVMYYAPKKR